MTRRQSNNQWSGGLAAHPAQNIPSAKIPWNSFGLDFLGSRRHPRHSLSSKGSNYQRGVLLISASAIEGHFEGETPAGMQASTGSCSCTTVSRFIGHLQPRSKWSTWASSVLITHPILRIWPRRNYHLFSGLKKKTIESSPIFVRR